MNSDNTPMQGVVFQELSKDELITLLDNKLDEKLAPINDSLKAIKLELESLSQRPSLNSEMRRTRMDKEQGFREL
ncbi:uncharacterized protein BKA55DRAFT_694092 [Fusarium redolens]|uniref:Uncharacterized protein n=1 Tax=Fusarium redolens TaxID=48865 RepID=A0A9P9GFI4_FUSRE|nr:uncharacterized protein BKA55DRAFT_694092 [Fusarium redolens]KAH7237605.1 hypothetical protein BKA55DRAFT_694092 [Fusarium redolens]